MIELEKSSVILWFEPFEPEEFRDFPQFDESFFAPRIEISRPDHWPFMILDRLIHGLNLPEKWSSKVKIHRVRIDHEELLLSSNNLDETDSRGFRRSQNRFPIDGREDTKDFLSKF